MTKSRNLTVIKITRSNSNITKELHTEEGNLITGRASALISPHLQSSVC